MVIQPKKNGKVSGTVNLSYLSKHRQEEYHGIELAEEERRKRSFLTEWGLFRYLSSGNS